MIDIKTLTKETIQYYNMYDYIHGLPYLQKRLEICQRVLSMIKHQFPQEALTAAYAVVLFHAAHSKTVYCHEFKNSEDRENAAKQYEKSISKLVNNDEYNKWYLPGIEAILYPTPRQVEVIFPDYCVDRIRERHTYTADELDYKKLLILYKNVLTSCILPIPGKTRKQILEPIIRHHIMNDEYKNDQQSIYWTMMFAYRQKVNLDQMPLLYQYLYSRAEITKHNELIDNTSETQIRNLYFEFERQIVLK